LGQPHSSSSADAAGAPRTIASIEMLDAIELEALLGQPTLHALEPQRARRHWARRWITTWLQPPRRIDDGRLTLPSRGLAILGCRSLQGRESFMLRRNFDVPPLTRLMQASVLVAFAMGMMVLAMHADNGAHTTAAELAGFNIVAP
jgi:hypothetical protein